MIVYLAAFKTIDKIFKESVEDIYLLSSFWEHRNGKFGDYVYQKKHMLDSGAFTIINDKAFRYNNFDWDNYVRKYIEFIKKTKQKLFYEVDIDHIIGLEKVEYYRKQIEDAIGIAPIPVWHYNRGTDYFIENCEKYPYVAVGTTRATKEGSIFRKNPILLSWFIEQAHKNNSKIHGLGFTDIKQLNKLKFDSIDSTSWIGGRYGILSIYDNGNIKYIKTGKRLKSTNIADIHGFKEWVKFQKYAEANL